MAELANRVRREQAETEFDLLLAEIDGWLARRREDDVRRQYRTQLGAVEALVRGAAQEFRGALAGIDLRRPPGEVYEACREVERGVVWLRRVWGFYQERFDQRDDLRLGPVLRAADEVVWSCHRQVAVQAEVWAPGTPAGPAPLPYVDSLLVPAALTVDKVPSELKTEIDTASLRRHLDRLPIPLVRLPPACVTAPWWLVYAGHEVGHHVQFGLLDRERLVGAFRTTIEKAVRDAGRGEQAAARWGNWSSEVFADVFSVLVMGEWAMWAITELERGPDAAMRKRRGRYPSPLVRLELLAATARRLGLDPTPAMGGLAPADLAAATAESADDLAVVPAVVAAALGPLPGVGPDLPRLAAFHADDYQPGGVVDRRARDLFAGLDRPAGRTLRDARLVTAAALAAWSSVAALDDDTERAARRAALATRTLALIVASAEEGTRAAAPPPVDLLGVGHDVGRELLLMSHESGSGGE